MSYTVVAQGDSSNTPSITLDPGYYTLTISVPFVPADWVLGSIETAIRSLGVRVGRIESDSGRKEIYVPFDVYSSGGYSGGSRGY